MKKFLLMAVLILSGASISRLFAVQQQDIPMQIIRTGSMGNSGTYAPPRPWYIVHVTGFSYTLSTTGWETGLYIVKVTLDNIILSEKIIIKS